MKNITENEIRDKYNLIKKKENLTLDKEKKKIYIKLFLPIKICSLFIFLILVHLYKYIFISFLVIVEFILKKLIENNGLS